MSKYQKESGGGVNAVQILNENKQLREELEKYRSNKQSRTFSPNKTSDLRAENKTQINTELQRLKKENEKLKE